MNYYSNHYTLKRNRLKVLKQQAGKCAICGEDLTLESFPKRKIHAHHIDKNKNNHIFSNLKVLCGKCHGQIHRRVRQLKLAIKPRKVFKEHLTANSLFGLRGRTPIKIQRYMSLYGKELSEKI